MAEPGPELTTRPLVAADQPWARRYWLERWGGTTVALRGASYDVSRLDGFVAERGGEPAGIVAYFVTGDGCEIITIDAVERFQGVGTALVERVEAEATRLGCRHLSVTMTNDNLSALRFYQRRGFRLEAVDPGAVDRTRGLTLTPGIPPVGEHGIPIRDEVRLGMALTGDNGEHSE